MKFEKFYRQTLKESPAPVEAPPKPSTVPSKPSTPQPKRRDPLSPTRPNIHPRPKATRLINPDVTKFLNRRKKK